MTPAMLGDRLQDLSSVAPVIFGPRASAASRAG
jgi:hypothetical protein